MLDFVNGYPFKPEDWGTSGTPIIRIQNLNGSKDFNFFDEMIPERFHVNAGDLLFCWSGSRGTSFGPRKWSGPLGYLNQHIFRCVVSDDLDADYAYFLLRGMTPAIEAEAHGGGGLVHIKKSELVRFEARIPPLDEQRRIAEVLLSVDAAVASARTAEQQAHQTHHCLLEAQFGAFAAGDPSHCDPIRLSDVCERVTYGFTNPMPTTDEGPWLVTALNVIRGEIDYETARHTSERAYNDLLTEKSRPTPGSILVTKDGTLGRVAVVDRPDICVNQSVAVLVPRQDRLIAEFLSFLLQSATAQKRMLAESGGGSVKHIYITKLAAMDVGVPSLDDQKDLIAQAFQSLAVIKTAKSATLGLVDLRTRLCADLLSGRVRVPA